ncbi:hypothetical protein [Vibrio sp. EA2]|uniref:hypothetical protein n=1 Tax=Vibrio sp. EA2 TaxID=3079860 RepID=UPI003982AE2A
MTRFIDVDCLSWHVGAVGADKLMEICDSAKEAVKNVDIITTVTADKRLATILTPDMVAPGVHINVVGGRIAPEKHLMRILN